MGSEKGVEFAAVERRKVILMAEGKGKLLGGKNKARDGDLSCLACTSETVCPLCVSTGMCYVGWLPRKWGRFGR